MSIPDSTLARLAQRPLIRHCCAAGAVAWPNHCPWHDAWRTVRFQAPPGTAQETEPWQ